MATKRVTPDVKPDKSQGQASGIKPSDVKRNEEIQKMIDFINTYTDHQVVTKAEYDQMKTPNPQGQPLRQNLFPDNPPPRPPPPTTPRRSSTSLFQLPVRPNIPHFYGENKSGEVTFDVWKYDVKCLMREGGLPETTIRQSIRNSLRGKARSILVTMGEDATPA